MSWTTNQHPVCSLSPPSRAGVGLPQDPLASSAQTGSVRSLSPTAPVQPRQKRVKFTGFVCALCDVTCNSDADVVQHLASRHHREQQQAGDLRVAAPSHVLPITRPPSLTAAAQLAAIVDLQWPGFAAETVTAMFYLRRRRAISGFYSAQLARTSTEEDFANLVLQQPTYIQEAAKQARERLACVDLPEGTATPTLVLSAASRDKLQIDCLHRRLRWTSLRENWRLLSMVALRCVMDGTAAHLLSDRHSPFLSQLANAVWESAGLPGSPYHWAFHNRLRPRPRDQRQRRHSSSDISNPEFRCDCRPRLQDLHAMYEDVLTELDDWEREMQHIKSTRESAARGGAGFTLPADDNLAFSFSGLYFGDDDLDAGHAGADY